ncbi:MAG TPA: multicopper oxidase family protein [Acetobacteraceae bacterium]|nr:multicopper oxidase family protein [Acetobacteraceae bacterium]
MDRRSFLKSAAAVAAGAFGPLPARADAQAGTNPTVLMLESRVIEVNGKAASVLGIAQPDGTRGIFMDVSTPFRVQVRNGLDTDSLIHWHGLTPPFRQDGVPYVSAPPIPAGARQDYDFKLDFAGTFWMHSHVGFQEQRLLSAPLIIRDGASEHGGAQEVVVMLHDFSFRSPDEIFAALRQRKESAGVAMASMKMPGATGQGTVAQGASGQGMSGQGMSATEAKPDLNDVDYDAFLANDRTLADPDIVGVEPGGRVRLRIINGSAATNFWISLGALRGTLIAVDGTAIKPMTIGTIPLAVAQRVDILLDLPAGAGAFPILAQVEGKTDRTGIVLATVGAKVGRIAENAATPAPAVTLDFEQSLTAAEPLAEREPGIVRDVLLTGDMQAYVWSMDNQVYPKITPIMVSAGKRVMFVMRNETMMSHPMHLHGHRFQVLAVNGRKFSGAVRDTVLVTPQASVTIAFDADNVGRWAFHCHNLYHLEAGMMTVVDYEGVKMPQIPASAG